MNMLIKAISITSYNSILFKAINAARKCDSISPRDFRFHISRSPLLSQRGQHFVRDCLNLTLCNFISQCQPAPALAHLAPLFFGGAHTICRYNVKCRWKNVRNLIKLRYLKSVCLGTCKSPLAHFPAFPAVSFSPRPTAAAVKWALPISACVTQKAATPTPTPIASQPANNSTRLDSTELFFSAARHGTPWIFPSFSQFAALLLSNATEVAISN